MEADVKKIKQALVGANKKPLILGPLDQLIEMETEKHKRTVEKEMEKQKRNAEGEAKKNK